MIISVTKKHIRRGIAGDARRCPVGLAIGEMVSDPCLCVRRSCTWVNGLTIFNPRSVRRFITRFDYGRWVRPFRFRLSLKEPR